MRYIIDRFEGDTAVLEDENKEFLNVPKSILPENSNESDCLVFEDGKYIIDEETTKELKEEISDLMDELFN
ncbi:MAG: DUF3006 domain-containing protein [bacterium]|nr:DUF3006 domain-containing protein [bacterium]MDD6225754.1 DUF3006 domain-containing protein [bacterium]